MDPNGPLILRRNIDVPTCVVLDFMLHYTTCVYCTVLATFHLGSIFIVSFMIGFFQNI